jgi:hypothetical protein
VPIATANSERITHTVPMRSTFTAWAYPDS